MVQRAKITYLMNSDSLTCYMTEGQLTTYGLQQDLSCLFLLVGSVTLKLKVVLTESNLEINRLHLSQDVKNYIFIPEGIALQIKGTDNDKLELGPYIGVFINHERIKYLINKRNFSEYTEYEATCRCHSGLLCFFSLEGIDWSSYTVEGIYRVGSSWIYGVLPLPKTIYNRNVENNCLTESLTLKKNLGEDFQILNTTPKLSKWETFLTLRKNIKLGALIPETVLYTTFRDVEKILNQHDAAYLKPNLLSKGRGIFRVSKLVDNQYRVEYRTSEVNHVVTLEDLKDIDILLSKYKDMGGGYIVQQEIQKACFRGNPYDLRVLFQKDYQGIWQVSGIAGRIGEPGSIITSPRSGGGVEELPIILEETFGNTNLLPQKLQDNIISIGKEICLSIEEEFGNSAELGLDLAIDVKGRIWIIEANGKPLRTSLKWLKNPEVISRCNRRPIEYMVYLTGFGASHLREEV
jgi:hypothetical protein